MYDFNSNSRNAKIRWNAPPCIRKMFVLVYKVDKFRCTCHCPTYTQHKLQVSPTPHGSFWFSIFQHHLWLVNNWKTQLSIIPKLTYSHGNLQPYNSVFQNETCLKSKTVSNHLPTKPNRVVLSWTPYVHNYDQYAYGTISDLLHVTWI